MKKFRKAGKFEKRIDQIMEELVTITERSTNQSIKDFYTALIEKIQLAKSFISEGAQNYMVLDNKKEYNYALRSYVYKETIFTEGTESVEITKCYQNTLSYPEEYDLVILIDYYACDDESIFEAINSLIWKAAFN